MSEEELQPVSPDSEERNAQDGEGTGEALERVIQVAGMYNNYFLDYASYVILERAVPHQDDGLKPVQRRILHSLDEMDDGRFHKVANVIGNTMKYHPHGDASIGDSRSQQQQERHKEESSDNGGIKSDPPQPWQGNSEGAFGGWADVRQV